MYQKDNDYYLTPSRSASPADLGSPEDDAYKILTPYPQFSGLIEGINPPYLAFLRQQHEILADGASLDELHANPWLVTGKRDTTPRVNEWAHVKIMVQLEDGTWEKRDQSPELDYEFGSDGEEILRLDGDVMERDLDTGFVGECDRVGCRKRMGCEECKGKRPTNLTPRTGFREVVHQVRQVQNQTNTQLNRPRTTEHSNLPRLRPPNTENAYPKHLQRLVNNSTVATYIPTQPIKPPPPPPPHKTGPKIKYIRKRVAPPMEKIVVGGHKKKKY